MIASYQARLLLQCLNSFFFAHLLSNCAILLLTPVCLWLTQRIRPRASVWILIGFRLLPVLAGFYVAFAVALPSYLRLEPETDSERIGAWALLIAVLAISLWVRPVARAIIASRRSSRFLKEAQLIGHAASIGSSTVWMLPEDRPRVAVAGLMRPRVLVSEALVELLPQDELEVVLVHEKAHQRSRDNLTRLLLLLLPDTLPCINFGAALEKAWKRLAEWAADDYAAAGDTHKSIALAGALVRFARFGSRPAACALAISLLDDSSELAVRVERLLGRPSAETHQVRTRLASVALSITTCTAILLVAHYASLPDVHQFLEFLSH